jgi:hypothetical protein
MEHFDEFVKLLLDNLENDDRIKLSKKIKYGCRHYYLTLNIDKINNNPNTSNTFSVIFRDSIEIHFDNRNLCIEINGYDEDNVIIEDKEILDKWSIILEEIVNKNIEKNIKDKIEWGLNECDNKSLLRQYQMKKLFE